MPRGNLVERSDCNADQRMRTAPFISTATSSPLDPTSHQPMCSFPSAPGIPRFNHFDGLHFRDPTYEPCARRTMEEIMHSRPAPKKRKSSRRHDEGDLEEADEPPPQKRPRKIAPKRETSAAGATVRCCNTDFRLAEFVRHNKVIHLGAPPSAEMGAAAMAAAAESVAMWPWSNLDDESLPQTRSRSAGDDVQEVYFTPSPPPSTVITCYTPVTEFAVRATARPAHAQRSLVPSLSICSTSSSLSDDQTVILAPASAGALLKPVPRKCAVHSPVDMEGFPLSPPLRTLSALSNKSSSAFASWGEVERESPSPMDDKLDSEHNIDEDTFSASASTSSSPFPGDINDKVKEMADGSASVRKTSWDNIPTLQATTTTATRKHSVFLPEGECPQLKLYLRRERDEPAPFHYPVSPPLSAPSSRTHSPNDLIVPSGRAMTLALRIIEDMAVGGRSNINSRSTVGVGDSAQHHQYSHQGAPTSPPHFSMFGNHPAADRHDSRATTFQSMESSCASPWGRLEDYGLDLREHCEENGVGDGVGASGELIGCSTEDFIADDVYQDAFTLEPPVGGGCERHQALAHHAHLRNPHPLQHPNHYQQLRLHHHNQHGVGCDRPRHAQADHARAALQNFAAAAAAADSLCDAAAFHELSGVGAGAVVDPALLQMALDHRHHHQHPFHAHPQSRPSLTSAAEGVGAAVSATADCSSAAGGRAQVPTMTLSELNAMMQIGFGGPPQGCRADVEHGAGGASGGGIEGGDDRGDGSGASGAGSGIGLLGCVDEQFWRDIINDGSHDGSNTNAAAATSAVASDGHNLRLVDPACFSFEAACAEGSGGSRNGGGLGLGVGTPSLRLLKSPFRDTLGLRSAAAPNAAASSWSSTFTMDTLLEDAGLDDGSDSVAAAASSSWFSHAVESIPPPAAGTTKPSSPDSAIRFFCSLFLCTQPHSSLPYRHFIGIGHVPVPVSDVWLDIWVDGGAHPGPSRGP
ncbi:hypothetical protein DFJ73DRAFT_763330 [Zopfochytrium polystomum]|nr:hypothetical protein DFJ73DRAFT_763330 [Zopfochytrium polystomum]